MLLRSLTLAAVAGLAFQATADSVRASVTVSRLTCPGCSFIAARSIDAFEGVEVLGFEGGDGGTGTFTVRFDDALLVPHAIEAAVKANGYDAALVAAAS